jgi:hypothetical protein
MHSKFNFLPSDISLNLSQCYIFAFLTNYIKSDPGCLVNQFSGSILPMIRGSFDSYI